MSCFGHRSSRPAPQAAALTAPHPRRNMPRVRTACTSSSAASDPDPDGAAPARPVPVEDLGATKRRLVCIRRQSEYAPVNLSVGFKSRTGWQALSCSKENQDSLALVLPLADPLQHYSLFAVFDGHGRAAHRVSSFAAETVTANFVALMTADKTTPPESALRKACLRTNRSIMNHRSLDVLMTGTTAAVAVIHGHSLICANIGDSRIVISSVREGVVTAVPVTTDHIPELPAEKKRIEEAGGRVERWSPGGLDTGPPRVWLKEKRLPGLSVSRVMGDSILKGIVTAEPEMTTYQLAEEDKYVIVATDGVWGQMSNEAVVQFIDSHGSETCQRIAEALVRHAATLWFEGGGESIDDISVILIRLNW